MPIRDIFYPPSPVRAGAPACRNILLRSNVCYRRAGWARASVDDIFAIDARRPATAHDAGHYYAIISSTFVRHRLVAIFEAVLLVCYAQASRSTAIRRSREEHSPSSPLSLPRPQLTPSSAGTASPRVIDAVDVDAIADHYRFLLVAAFVNTFLMTLYYFSLRHYITSSKHIITTLLFRPLLFIRQNICSDERGHFTPMLSAVITPYAPFHERYYCLMATAAMAGWAYLLRMAPAVCPIAGMFILFIA